MSCHPVPKGQLTYPKRTYHTYKPCIGMATGVCALYNSCITTNVGECPYGVCKLALGLFAARENGSAKRDQSGVVTQGAEKSLELFSIGFQQRALVVGVFIIE